MRVPIAIVDYEAGNLTSVLNALQFLGFPAVVTKDPKVLSHADRVVFPGVGAAASSMRILHESGLGLAIQEAVQFGKPVLGICIGCQVILSHSEEDGGVDCLGILPGKAVKFQNEPFLKIPHMGWNQVHFADSNPHPIFQGLADRSDFYFVHSYHPLMAQSSLVATYTTYGTQTFASTIFRDNLVATQFHLEKSGDVGLEVLRNFCKWDGKLC